uniref:Limonene synthase n=1 Tax=Eleutherococcus trifoliatus TaxID=46385 RepID=A0A0D3ML99_ELETR|nr:limonene synthase [Eleutherococcus trifoliatus]
MFFSPLTVSPARCVSLLSPKNHPRIRNSKSIQCNATATTIDHDQELNRRSANYPPSFWDYNFVKSLTSDYTEEKYVSQVEKLKDEVQHLINGDMDVPLLMLELIDSVQRLGLKYKFEKDIKKALDVIYNDKNDAWLSSDLYSTALQFRLLRQHGYDVPQDVFERFKNENGSFKASICEDVKGLLSLYEASFFGFKGEDIIDEAKAFATKHLKKIKGNLSPSMVRKVNHALDMPLHWKLPRMEARWFIDTYEQEPNKNPNLLQLAKLDYNIVQSIHQKEVGELARWWVDLGLDKVTFSRDRLMEHYFWCNGMVSDPQYGAFRDMTTKVTCFITLIDDVYDVYGSIEELELFTDFVDRWDITEIDKLPNNIKAVLLAMFNGTNDIGYWTLKERGFNIIPYLSKQWAKLCKAYFTEAKWFHQGYKPTLDEYLDNAVVSIAAPIMLFCSYFLTTDKITVDALNYIDKLPSIMWCPSMLLRLTNDLGTSSGELARGDSLKAVQCYMNDTGATEEVAREHIKSLVHETWKTLNKDMLGSYPFSEACLTANPNLGRTTQCMYQHGDGHGIPDRWTKDNVISLLVEPFTLD